MGLLSSLGKGLKENERKINELVAQYEGYPTSKLKSMYSDANFQRRAAIIKILKSRGEWNGD